MRDRTSAKSTLSLRWKRAVPALLIVVVVGLLMIGRFGGVLDLDRLATISGDLIKEFSGSPLGPLLIIVTFCIAAFFAVPQFVLIGIAIIAFGPALGAFWAWMATLSSGSLTYWAGRVSSNSLQSQLDRPRVAKFVGLIAKNAFAASALVRNIPTGPFLLVNMLFGAVRAPYVGFLGGMAIGVVPKILIVSFGLQAIQAALSGRLFLALGAGFVSATLILGGWLYVKKRRRDAQDYSLNG